MFSFVKKNYISYFYGKISLIFASQLNQYTDNFHIVHKYYKLRRVKFGLYFTKIFLCTFLIVTIIIFFKFPPCKKILNKLFTKLSLVVAQDWKYEVPFENRTHSLLTITLKNYK